jgi:hypothetical protein
MNCPFAQASYLLHDYEDSNQVGIAHQNLHRLQSIFHLAKEMESGMGRSQIL